jgi:hypothetical protein
MAVQQSANTGVKIVAVIEALLLVLLCSGLIYFGVQRAQRFLDGLFGKVDRDGQGSEAAVERFLREIRDDELDIAYQSTTQEFKKHMNWTEFERLIEEHAAIKESRPMTSISVGDMSRSRDARHYRRKIEGLDLEVIISVVKKDGRFEVDQFSIIEGEKQEHGRASPKGQAKPQK